MIDLLSMFHPVELVAIIAILIVLLTAAVVFCIGALMVNMRLVVRLVERDDRYDEALARIDDLERERLAASKVKMALWAGERDEERA